MSDSMILIIIARKGGEMKEKWNKGKDKCRFIQILASL